jgi:alkyldihydroxyacetonephosphate synthase
MAWDAWGDPAAATPLSAAVRGLLEQVFGPTEHRGPARAAEAVALRSAALDERRRDGLAALVGAEHVRIDHAARLAHAGGKSAFDLLRRRADGPQDAPDAVVLPADHAEVVRVLGYCATERIAVVPFGGGTSVVGGVAPHRAGFVAVIALDLRRLDTLTEIDPISRTATLGAGLSGPQAEELLAAHGLSLGHFPQSFQFATIGGFAATRSSGQASAGYGRFDDMIERLVVATPTGTLRLGRAPATAAGPDLRELFSGSEGAFGVITAVTVRVHPIPERTAYRAWSFPDFAAGADALRAVAQADVRPTVLRLSDEAETGLNLALSHRVGAGAVTSGCLAVTTFEGTAGHVESRAAEAAALLRAAGGVDLGAEPAQEWERGRFSAPYLRDALLDAGVLAETLETATAWSRLGAVKDAVTHALTAELPDPTLVLCHISHTYPTGASLYFTVVCAAGGQPLERWRRAKHAASQAIMDAGGTITHHHAVGVDHRDWLGEEIGEAGVAVLRAVKSAVDPAGVLNPGKLVP